MIPAWLPYAVAVGVLMFLVGCLGVLFAGRRTTPRRTPRRDNDSGLFILDQTGDDA